MLFLLRLFYILYSSTERKTVTMMMMTTVTVNLNKQITEITCHVVRYTLHPPPPPPPTPPENQPVVVVS